jgi:hypothetical protein
MAAPLLAVDAPVFTPERRGILSVANIYPDIARIGMGGVAYPALGVESAKPIQTPNSCFITGTVSPSTKSYPIGFDDITSIAFALYTGVECWLDGGDDYGSTASAALNAGEGFGIAKYLRSLLLDVSPVSLGTTLDPVLALAKAEQYARVNYNGVPVIHVSAYGATILDGLGLLQSDLDGRLRTRLGSLVSADAGYDAAIAETTTFNLWVTGQVNLWYTPPIVSTGQDRAHNKAEALAERVYALTVDSFHAKATVNAATVSNRT